LDEFLPELRKTFFLALRVTPLNEEVLALDIP